MIKRHVFTTGLVSIGLMVVLSQFQNCASAPAVRVNTPDEKLTLQAPPSDIVFTRKQTVASDSAAIVRLDGSCSIEHDGADVEWSLLTNESSDKPIETGVARCELGTFHFQIVLSDGIDCDLEHLVVVMAPWGDTTRSHLVKRCQPLASQKVPSDSQGSADPNLECKLDFNIRSDHLGSRLCEKVCFSNNRMVSQEIKPEHDCEALAAVLAGP